MMLETAQFWSPFGGSFEEPGPVNPRKRRLEDLDHHDFAVAGETLDTETMTENA